MKAMKFLVFGLLAVGSVVSARADYPKAYKNLYEEVAYFEQIDNVGSDISVRLGFESENTMFLFFKIKFRPNTETGQVNPDNMEMVIRFDKDDAQQVVLAIKKYYEWCDTAKKNGLSDIRKEIATIGKAQLIFEAPNKLVWKGGDIFSTYRRVYWEKLEGKFSYVNTITFGGSRPDEVVFLNVTEASELKGFRMVLEKLPALLNSADAVKDREERAKDLLK